MKTQNPYVMVVLLLALLPLFPGSSCHQDRSENNKQPFNATETFPHREVSWIRGSSFAGSSLGWLLTLDGEILFSADGGQTWREMANLKTENIFGITFVDEQTGWAANDSGKLWQTTDGGATWQAISSIDIDQSDFVGVHQLIANDKQNVYLVGSNTFISRTTDGGRNWDNILLPEVYTDRGWRGCFISPQTGWLTNSSGLMLRTRDAGNTWDSAQVVENDRLILTFIDEKMGWAVSFDRLKVFRTTDGGKKWELLTLLDGEKEGLAILSLHFVDEDEGWAVGKDSFDPTSHDPKGVVLHTTDGGKNWDRVVLKEDEWMYSKVWFSDKQHGWVISRDNVYRTDDGGKTWSISLSFPPLRKDPRNK